MMTPSDIDKKIKIRSLTVKEVYDLAHVDFEKECPVKILNGLIVRCSSLVGIQNNIVGGLLVDILKLSDLDFTEETKEKLARISSIANTYPAIFSNSTERQDLKDVITISYKDVALDIQLDVKQLLKNKFKIYSKMMIQPSELDNLPYWEYKYYLNKL